MQNDKRPNLRCALAAGANTKTIQKHIELEMAKRVTDSSEIPISIVTKIS